MAEPLDGIRVIEITMFQQGPVAGTLLGDLGADVIKIEARTGDPARGFMKIIGVMTGLKGRNYYFENNNRNKRSIVLDLKKEKGLEVFFKLIAQWTNELTPYDVMQALQMAGVAAGPSFNIEELLNNPHTKESGMFVEQNHPEAGKTITYRSPFKLGETDVRISGPAPLLGEHNSYVFKKLLGMSDKEFANLVDEKVIY